MAQGLRNSPSGIKPQVMDMNGMHDMYFTPLKPAHPPLLSFCFAGQWQSVAAGARRGSPGGNLPSVPAGGVRSGPGRTGRRAPRPRGDPGGRARPGGNPMLPAAHTQCSSRGLSKQRGRSPKVFRPELRQRKQVRVGGDKLGARGDWPWPRAEIATAVPGPTPAPVRCHHMSTSAYGHGPSTLYLSI